MNRRAARRQSWFDTGADRPSAELYEIGGSERARWIQRSLNRILGLRLAEDGTLGPQTRSAIRSFQAQRGLTVDGIVGPITERALRAALGGSDAGGATGAAPPAAPPPTSSPRDWAQTPLAERMRYVMNLLVSRYGYPPNGAAGLVGNLVAESGLIPSRIEGSQTATPLRARDFQDRTADFTASQVMNRSSQARTGPKLAGVGLAQWTFRTRRAGLFRHVFQGRALGPNVLVDMDAQVDYLVSELRASYPSVNRVLLNPATSLDAASDDTLYRFERPGVVVNFPRADARVQRVVQTRRGLARQALQAFQQQLETPAVVGGTTAAIAPGPFRPMAVERPGGGRIQDKREPAAADLTNVAAYGNGRVILHRLAAAALQALIASARAHGIAEPLLLPVSGFRSVAEQRTIWEAALRKYGGDEARTRTFVAPPGRSAHHSGRAVDLWLGANVTSENVARLRSTPEHGWLLRNAAQFGFYPYDREPWHWEYNPPVASESELFMSSRSAVRRRPCAA